MIKPVFKLSGNVISEPLNYRELSIELNFDKDDPAYRGQVSTNSWELGVGDNYSQEDGVRQALGYIDAGTKGGEGVFQGLEFTIDIDRDGEIINIFDGYLDLSTSEIYCDKIIADSKEIGGVDWLNEVADSFTFEYLATPSDGLGAGTINNKDYVYVPYIIQKDFDELQAAVVTITAFTVLAELVDIILAIIGMATGMLAEMAVYAIVFMIIQMIVRLLLIIVASKQLTQQLTTLLLPKVKYAAGMYAFDLCYYGAKHLGFDEFRSETILQTDVWRRAVIVSEIYRTLTNDTGKKRGLLKNIKERDYGADNLPAANNLKGFYRGTFGDLLRVLKDMFNAKVVIEENGGKKILRLEKNSYINTNDLYELPDIDKSELSYRFNHEDLVSNYSATFVPDINDKHSWQNFEGTEYQVITSPKITPSNLRARLNKGERTVNMPFSLAVRKEELNWIERALDDVNETIADIIAPFELAANLPLILINAFIRAVYKIINIIRAVISPNSASKKPPQLPLIAITKQLREKVERRRLYVMLMEQNFLNNPKLLLTNLNNVQGKLPNFRERVKVADDNRDYVNAEYILNEFHSDNWFINEVDGVTEYPNQYKIYTVPEVNFCIEDYLKVRKSKYFYDSDGVTVGEIISVKWNVYKETAEITYKVKSVYTTNLKQTKVLSDGR